MVPADQLSKVFSALSDPTRRGILLRLGDGSATVSELAEPFPISLPAVSRHLKVLERAGLISRDRRAQRRTSTLQAEPLKAATTWIEHLARIQKPADNPATTTDKGHHQGPFRENSRAMSAVGWNQSMFKLDALLATPATFRSPTGTAGQE